MLLHTRRDLILEASSKARHRVPSNFCKKSRRRWTRFLPFVAHRTVPAFERDIKRDRIREKGSKSIFECVCVCMCVCTILHYRRDEGPVCEKIEEGRARSSSREHENLKSRKLESSKTGRLGSSCFSFHISHFSFLGSTV